MHREVEMETGMETDMITDLVPLCDQMNMVVHCVFEMIIVLSDK